MSKCHRDQGWAGVMHYTGSVTLFTEHLLCTKHGTRHSGMLPWVILMTTMKGGDDHPYCADGGN